jgi:hypothetical protein
MDLTQVFTKQQSDVIRIGNSLLDPVEREEEIIYADCTGCGEKEVEDNLNYGLCPKCEQLALEKWKNFRRSCSEAQLEYYVDSMVDF